MSGTQIPRLPEGGREAELVSVRDQGFSVSPASPTRSAGPLEEVLRMRGAFSGSWMRRSAWRAPVRVWCSNVSVQPSRRKELGPKVRERGEKRAEARPCLGVCPCQLQKQPWQGLHGVGAECRNASPPASPCFMHTRVHSLTYPAHVLSSCSVLGTVLCRGEPGLCAP